MNIKMLQQFIAEEAAVALYFYSDACAPCKILRPKVEELLSTKYPGIKLTFINATEENAIAAGFDVYSAPVILVFFEGKEYIRESKNISISELDDKIGRLYAMLFDN
jgi:thioredoxin-like negative regulator of GroEL